ncbi:MAG: hypothetical protein JRI93_07750 [Deltaproteobacteria bacterium]|nr:hypothetical protein [Deltaproteobacteria bacterium]
MGLGLLAAVTGLCSAYLLSRSWDYNAIDTGDETAKGLGVRVERHLFKEWKNLLCRFAIRG